MLQIVPVREAVQHVCGIIPRGACSRRSAPVRSALGLVLSRDVVAAGDLPPYPRSTVDGFAVRATDTYGASESMPAFLDLSGEVAMGSLPEAPLAAGCAVRISTGGALPAGADAVAMLEYCEEPGDGTVAVGYAVGPGENVVRRGEDVAAGTTLLTDGHRLRPQDLGALEGLGFTGVEVYGKPRVGVISTGDEVVEASVQPAPGQIRDVNGAAICASLERDGLAPEFLGVVPDDRARLEDSIRRALRFDAVVVSGGSSAGTRDMVASVFDSLGRPGVVVHGLALRPGKPTIMAVLDGKFAAGLPGHPSSALVAYEAAIRPVLRRVAGEVPQEGAGVMAGIPIKARCSRSISSRPGREEFIRCSLRWDGDEVWADPVLGKSGLISTMVRAQAFIHVPLDSDGAGAGSPVDVYLFG
ncbi:MAG: gephyrin-like molybdotransferase Glp [Ignavibacteriales bacterium]